ncbi:hypothetical protein HanXRQr2_Chr14g0632151 [Helianthus annuus]|uniref:Uncharacterized protein n=1 Tax=Helianthus annuus TaxID=4232 RepID=A0A9K3E705_HELAN|nr:hypothetical protein HanXRQr2_Chr14g0632151 [Helianthus annuus]KAJ0839398.1 hypothetical protein HanPSC8_Chr14g0606321 [Helianthus annuus]
MTYGLTPVGTLTVDSSMHCLANPLKVLPIPLVMLVTEIDILCFNYFVSMSQYRLCFIIAGQTRKTNKISLK